MEFDCPHCGQGLSAVPEDAGIVVDCPQCGKPVQIPAMPKVGVISSHSNVRGPRLRRPPRTLAERIADVRASAHPKVPKPPAVTIAAFLIVAGVFWGVFDILTNTIVPLSDMAIALFVASSCLMLFLAVGINSGFGWCRVLFLVLSVLGLFFSIIALVLMFRSEGTIPFQFLGGTGLSIIELFLLAPSSVGRWYRAKAEGNAE